MTSTRNQPQYDFLSGSGAPSPARPRAASTSVKRHSEYRQNQPLPQNQEDVHARIRTLEYEVATLKQEKELTVLQHGQELHDLTQKAEEDFRRSQKFESANNATQRRYEQLLRETQDKEASVVNEKAELERRVRTLTGQRATLEEERNEAVEALSNFEREMQRGKVEKDQQQTSLQKSFDLLRGDFDAQLAVAQAAQQKLAEREAQVGQLEAQVVALKASGGNEEVDVLKRQLSEQVLQIKRLEKQTRTQNAELTEFKKQQKSLEVVEEEKRGLETRLKRMQVLGDELAQAQLRIQVLEEEKNSWASYLEGQAEEDQFDSPADMARAFLQQRIENASLVEQLGAIQPELSTKDESIRALEEERTRLQADLQQLKSVPPTTAAPDTKAKARLERQKTLAVKETEYLRAQLKAMDDEQQEFSPERFSEETSNKIKELQDLVDAHRAEMEKLHADLSALEAQAPPASPSLNPKKRSLEDPASDERLGELLRKNRKLQEELSKYKTKTDVLEAEAKAQTKQLEGLRSDKSSRHRILELRNNPTSTVHAIKQSTLDALKEENETLRAQLEGTLPTSTGSTRSSKTPDTLIPKASLHALQLALQEKDQQLASKEKSLKRLRDIFAAKAHEFREAVFSLLGWKLEFQPNGRVKATSMFHPGKKAKKSGDADGVGDDEEDEGNFIVFDGENATMKVSGGVRSEFAKEIRGLIEFWVEGRGQIPCLLAAMTLEFFDRYHDQQKK